jgi:hypothetical protein
MRVYVNGRVLRWNLLEWFWELRRPRRVSPVGQERDGIRGLVQTGRNRAAIVRKGLRVGGSGRVVYHKRLSRSMLRLHLLLLLLLLPWDAGRAGRERNGTDDACSRWRSLVGGDLYRRRRGVERIVGIQLGHGLEVKSVERHSLLVMEMERVEGVIEHGDGLKYCELPIR